MIPTTKPNASPCDEMICYRRIKCSPLSQQQQVQQQQQQVQQQQQQTLHF